MIVTQPYMGDISYTVLLTDEEDEKAKLPGALLQGEHDGLQASGVPRR